MKQTIKKILSISVLAFSFVCAITSSTFAQNLALELQQLSDATKKPFGHGHEHRSDKQKKWTFVVYIAGNNNLQKFTLRNIRQMMNVGSNDDINILVHLDLWGHKNTVRYYVEKNQVKIVGNIVTNSQTATGTTQSLYDCMRWATIDYPADHYALILWNHGSGILDPHIWGRLLNNDRDELFFFNPETCLLELDRDAIVRSTFGMRGIAFNDTFETYISNQDLKETLEKICHHLLDGKKIDILGMDACHMAMLEVASQMKNSVDYMVASQEIEPGPGWNYTLFLEKFAQQAFEPEEFAHEISFAYGSEYQNITSDYTQSAVDLNKIKAVEDNVTQVSETLIALLNSDAKAQIANALKNIRTSHRYTTAFYNHNYIDLHHFYMSLNEVLPSVMQQAGLQTVVATLQDQIKKGLVLIEDYVVHNVSGPSLSKARGVSIYFPTRNIHTSYLKTTFAQTTAWIDFIAQYLNKTGRININPENIQVTHEIDIIPGINMPGIREDSDE